MRFKAGGVVEGSKFEMIITCRNFMRRIEEAYSLRIRGGVVDQPTQVMFAWIPMGLATIVNKIVYNDHFYRLNL